MPVKQWRFRLQHMLDAIAMMQRHCVGMDFGQFAQDRKTQAAVAYEFLVLGEAARAVPAEVRHAHPEIPWQELIDVRNLLAHDYEYIDVEAVWLAITDDLPPLVAPLKAFQATL